MNSNGLKSIIACYYIFFLIIQVVSNLMISHIELRSEDSLDIVKYTHQRDLELMVVDVGPTINRIRLKFVAVSIVI